MSTRNILPGTKVVVFSEAYSQFGVRGTLVSDVREDTYCVVTIRRADGSLFRTEGRAYVAPELV